MIKFKKIDVHSAISKIDNDDIAIIDIRDKADYDKKHFKYSVNLSSLGTNPEKVRNLKKIDKGKNILVYGDAPNKIERAVSVLREFGYRNVYFSL